MKDKRLKIHDVARMTAIPEKELRDIAKTYDRLIPSQKIGKVRLYEEKATGFFEKISALSRQGLDEEEIRDRLASRMHSGRTSRSAQMQLQQSGRQSPASVPTQPTITSTPAPSILPDRVILGLREKDALQDRRIAKFTERIAALEKQTAEMNGTLAMLVERLEESATVQSRQAKATDEWIEHFEKRMDAERTAFEEQAERFREWLDYFEREIDELKKPVTQKMRERFRQ